MSSTHDSPSSVTGVPSSSAHPVFGGEHAANDRQQTVISVPRPEGASSHISGVLVPTDSPFSRTPSPVSLKLFPGQRPVDGIDAVEGQTLGHFVIRSRIGAGGMGTVFLADDEKLQRQVALKVLSPQQTSDPASVQRFQNEARSAARLDHDHVARVFFYGDDHGLHYIAYEYVQGGNLRDLIRTRGRLEPAEVVAYAVQLTSALCHLSACGVVHRDIKPSNIIITPQGKSKLVDLGLARKESLEESAELTVAGTTLGTFDYISPEQARDPRYVDVRSDIYSLGCTLYHALTGEPPFPEGTVLQRLLDHQDKDPPDPAVKNRRVSPALSAVVRKMMASDVKRRYGSAEALLHDLVLLAGAMGLKSLPDSNASLLKNLGQPQGKWWQRYANWIVTAAGLLLVAGFWQFFSENPAAVPLITQTPSPEEQAEPRLDHVPLRTPVLPSPERGVDSPLAAPHRTDVEAVTVSPFIQVPSAIEEAPAALLPQPERQPSIAPGGTSGIVDVPPFSNEPGVQPLTMELASQLPLLGRTIGPFFPLSTDLLLKSDLSPGTEPGKSGGIEMRPGETAQNRTTNPQFPVAAPQTGALSPNGAPVTTSQQPGSSTGTEGTAVATATGSLPGRSPDSGLTNVPPATPGNPIGSGTGPGIPPVPGSPESIRPATVQVGPFVIAGTTQSYSSLEAACNDLRETGTIELHFDGVRGEPERPFRIMNKRVTIQAARGRKPVLLFRTKEGVADPLQSRMISVIGGSLTVMNVGIELQIRSALGSEPRALFRLERPERLRLERCFITISNTPQIAAVVVECAAPPTTFAKMGAMKDGQPVVATEILLEYCVVRGEASGIWQHDTTPLTCDFRGSFFALSEWLLKSQQADNGMPITTDTSLTLSDNTCLMGQGLLQCATAGEMTERSPELKISARSNIFSVGPGVPFIEQTIPQESMDLRPLLRWSGDRNLFDGIQCMRLLRFQTPPSEDRWDFNAWQSYWGSGEISGLHNQPIAWAREWRQTPWSRLSPEEARSNLSADAIASGLILDEPEAGVDWNLLPSLPPAGPQRMP